MDDPGRGPLPNGASTLNAMGTYYGVLRRMEDKTPFPQQRPVSHSWVKEG